MESPTLRCSPPVVEFVATAASQPRPPQKRTISIINTGSKSQRVSLHLAEGPGLRKAFGLKVPHAGRIAPGMAQPVEVIYYGGTVASARHNESVIEISGEEVTEVVRLPITLTSTTDNPTLDRDRDLLANKSGYLSTARKSLTSSNSAMETLALPQSSFEPSSHNLKPSRSLSPSPSRWAQLDPVGASMQGARLQAYKHRQEDRLTSTMQRAMDAGITLEEQLAAEAAAANEAEEASKWVVTSDGLRIPRDLRGVGAVSAALTATVGKLKPRDIQRAIAAKRAQEAELVRAAEESAQVEPEGDSNLSGYQPALQLTTSASQTRSVSPDARGSSPRHGDRTIKPHRLFAMDPSSLEAAYLATSPLGLLLRWSSNQGSTAGSRAKRSVPPDALPMVVAALEQTPDDEPIDTGTLLDEALNTHLSGQDRQFATQARLTAAAAAASEAMKLREMSFASAANTADAIERSRELTRGTWMGTDEPTPNEIMRIESFRKLLGRAEALVEARLSRAQQGVEIVPEGPQQYTSPLAGLGVASAVVVGVNASEVKGENQAKKLIATSSLTNVDAGGVRAIRRLAVSRFRRAASIVIHRLRADKRLSRIVPAARARIQSSEETDAAQRLDQADIQHSESDFRESIPSAKGPAEFPVTVDAITSGLFAGLTLQPSQIRPTRFPVPVLIEEEFSSGRTSGAALTGSGAVSPESAASATSPAATNAGIATQVGTLSAAHTAAATYDFSRPLAVSLPTWFNEHAPFTIPVWPAAGLMGYHPLPLPAVPTCLPLEYDRPLRYGGAAELDAAASGFVMPLPGQRQSALPGARVAMQEPRVVEALAIALDPVPYHTLQRGRAIAMGPDFSFIGVPPSALSMPRGAFSGYGIGGMWRDSATGQRLGPPVEASDEYALGAWARVRAGPISSAAPPLPPEFAPQPVFGGASAADEDASVPWTRLPLASGQVLGAALGTSSWRAVDIPAVTPATGRQLAAASTVSSPSAPAGIVGTTAPTSTLALPSITLTDHSGSVSLRVAEVYRPVLGGMFPDPMLPFLAELPPPPTVTTPRATVRPRIDTDAVPNDQRQYVFAQDPAAAGSLTADERFGVQRTKAADSGSRLTRSLAASESGTSTGSLSVDPVHAIETYLGPGSALVFGPRAGQSIGIGVGSTGTAESKAAAAPTGILPPSSAKQAWLALAANYSKASRERC